MIYLHKLLPILLSPIFVVFFLVIVGALTSSKKITIFAASLLYLLSTPFFANEALRYVEGYSVKKSLAEVENAKAIVVLSGMLTSAPTKEGSTPEWFDPDRFFAGIELLKAGKAPELIFTRGSAPWLGDQQLEGEYPKQLAASLGIPESSIQLTQKAFNTQEEAEALTKLPLAKGSRIILVTSAYHMKRAEGIFERAGFEVEAYPVDFKVDQNKHLGLLEFLPESQALNNSSIAIRELIGRFYYQVLVKTK